MSGQINLYHPRFLKQRDLLALGNVAIAAATVYVLLAAVGGWVWQYAAMRSDAATAAEAQLKSAKERVEAETKAAASRKPDPQLAAELEAAESRLRRRVEIAGLLESGTIGSTGGFAEYLRGFARQASEGLWLTGFSIGTGGNDMEIRGSVLDPTALPDYIRRLGAEKAFQGRSFAALTMNRVGKPPAPNLAGQGATAAPAAAPTLRPIDFVLTPTTVEAKGGKP
jgi:hypothetical protein